MPHYKKENNKPTTKGNPPPTINHKLRTWNLPIPTNLEIIALTKDLSRTSKVVEKVKHDFLSQSRKSSLGHAISL
jgi:hypothetical protein